MNRRSLFRGLLAAAVGSCVRWLPVGSSPQALPLKPKMAVAKFLVLAPMNDYREFGITITDPESGLWVTEPTIIRLRGCELRAWENGVGDALLYQTHKSLQSLEPYLRDHGYEIVTEHGSPL